MIGLERDVVRVVPYTAEWKRLFEEEKARLQAAIGPYVLDIQHVGSTSIPGMVAKPIIDIGISVTSFEGARVCIQPVEQLGYKYRGEFGIPLRHYFVKGDPRTHHLHMHELGSPDWENQVLFRDYLIQRPALAEEYAALKVDLAQRYPADRGAYLDAKAPFIQRVMEMARSTAYEIRQATVEDCPGLAQVQVDSYRTAYAGLFPEPYLARFSYEEQEQDWREWLTTGGEDSLLVAVSNEGRVLGYVLARADRDLLPGYDAEIVALHVRESLQRKGIGKALLGRAVEELETRGCGSVMLWTLKGNRVRRWYRRLGGKVVGEKSVRVEDWDIVEIAYGWEKLSALLPGDRPVQGLQAFLPR
jgi:GrpB-like predicted nucleotidyltransferase (UPF0157 family)/ribosomal protein S18 acetylase RimI-like enzyme